MNKAIIGLVVRCAAFWLRPLLKRRIGLKMRQHCQQMAATYKQMMAGQSEAPGEAAGTREHCTQMAAQFRGDDAAAKTREPPEREARQFASQGKVVGTA